MIENKRYCRLDDFEHWNVVKDNVTTEIYDDAKDIADLLNELTYENGQLKQFKEDVFDRIDMHLRMLPTARDNEFNEDDGDPSLYTGAIYMLETLKKELKE